MPLTTTQRTQLRLLAYELFEALAVKLQLDEKRLRLRPYYRKQRYMVARLLQTKAGLGAHELQLVLGPILCAEMDYTKVVDYRYQKADSALVRTMMSTVRRSEIPLDAYRGLARQPEPRMVDLASLSPELRAQVEKELESRSEREDHLLTYREAAVKYGLTYTTLRTYVHMGRIKPVVTGPNERRITHREMRRFKATHRPHRWPRCTEDSQHATAVNA